jgi:hypothetical protein
MCSLISNRAIGSLVASQFLNQMHSTLPSPEVGPQTLRNEQILNYDFYF